MKQTRFDHPVRRALVAAALAVPVLAAPPRAGAQGFGLNEIGTCAVARAGAGAGAPCQDASRIYWNPAAAVHLPGVNLLVGAAAVAVTGDFAHDWTGRLDEGDVPVEVPPHLFATYQVQRRFNIGFGVYVPYGLTSQWKEDFPGRFSALKASLASIYMQPNFAFDVVPGRLAIGGGPVIGLSDVELQQSLDLSTVPLPGRAPATFAAVGVTRGTEFGRSTLTGQSVAWGYNLGVHARLGSSLQIGARYLSQIDFDFNGAVAEFEQVPTGLVLGSTLAGTPFVAGLPLDQVLAAQFQPGAPLSTRGVRTSISHPAQAQVGVGFTGIPNTTLNLDYAWVGWSAFEELPVNFGGPNAPPSRTIYEDYEDSHAVRASLDYAFRNGWKAMVGAHVISTPAPDVTVTPLLPEQDRYNFAGGVSIPFGRYALDAAYLRVETPGRRGRVVERTSRSETAEELNSGWYNLNANIFSLSLRASF